MSAKVLSCPRDHGGLTPQLFESIVQVDHCASCGGVFLDKGELEKIEDATAKEYADQVKDPDGGAAEACEMARQLERKEANCPKCDGEMEKQEYGFCSNVLIDTCPKCGGIWLDHGELKEIMVFFERSKLESTPLPSRLWTFLHNLFGQKQRT
jgi:Zn-finger nucleic acid-binding protein